jgi:hypothetical protein
MRWMNNVDKGERRMKKENEEQHRPADSPHHTSTFKCETEPPTKSPHSMTELEGDVSGGHR